MNHSLETLVDLFSTFPERGDLPAFIHRTGIRRLVTTYAELHLIALRVASWLAANGVEPGDRLLIWAPNSPWWGALFWGCVARGVVVVPVDFMAGVERAETICRLTAARLVVQSRAKDTPVTGLPSYFIEDLPYLLPDHEPAPVIHLPAAAEIAQLIYTSGTTGDPKGVILTHGNLMTNLRQVNSHICVVSSGYRFLSCLPLSHMFEQMGGFFTPLLNGASIVYLRTLKPSALMAAFGAEDIRAVIVVPRLLQLLRNSIEQELAAKGLDRWYDRARSHSSVRRLLNSLIKRKFGENFTLFVSGGAPLSIDLFDFWNELGFRVLEGYGLTECSPVLTANLFDRQVPGAVGVPLPGVEIRFEQGELLARGGNIFPGYYLNEEATRQAFTDDGWFRTGDVGEYDAEGFIHLKGRRKELIVTGAGINVYPDEIEDLLNREAGVREACVLGLDRGSGEEVHAVLILDGSRSAAKVVQDVNERLDQLQQITGFTVWPDSDFPKTTTMKIRKYLVKSRLQEGRGSDTASGGTDRLTAIIARITCCRMEEIGESSYLVANLGLTSIARLELVNALEQEFRLDLDDSLITPQTRVSDLRGFITRREKLRVASKFRPWVNSSPIRVLRRLCDTFLHFPLLRLFVELEVQGAEELAKVDPPVIFIANHVSYLDQPVIMRALTPGWRYNTATAVWAEFFFKNFRNIAQRAWKILTYEYGTLALNLFPLPQSQGFRSSLEYMGRLIDRGINLLVFPEGERTTTGRMLPFKEGLGIMVKELDVPVIPVRIEGLEKVFPRGAGWPRRGRVKIIFGTPVRYGPEAPEEIVAKARDAIVDLGRRNSLN